MYKRQAQGLIAAGAYVLLDIFGVDHAAVAQGNAVLLLIEIRVGQRLDAAGGTYGLLVQQAGHNADVYKRQEPQVPPPIITAVLASNK